MKMIKILSVVIVLAVILVVYLAVYPESSKVRRYCDRIEVGMPRSSVEGILKTFLGEDLDSVVVDDMHIYFMDRGVDCDIDFDADNRVLKVNSAVDAL